MYYEIIGTPIPKGRPRFGNGRTYTPKKTELAELEAKRQIRKQHKGAPLTGALEITVRFGMPIPASWPNKKKVAALSGSILPEGRPDLDNLKKLLGDALNGVLWVDDSQIVALHALKYYSDHPSTQISIGRPVLAQWHVVHNVVPIK